MPRLCGRDPRHLTGRNFGINFKILYSNFLQITVTESKKQQVKLLVEKKTINSHAVDYDQLAAVIRVEGASFPTHVGLLDDDLKHWFRMNRTKEHWNLFAVC